MGYCLNTVANFISSNFDFPSAENLSILGDMLPASNEVFNLGSDDMKWKDLYLSGETIYLGKSKITNDASSGISFRDESNNAINLTVSSISIQDPSQQNKKVTLQADSDENVSNYVKSTSNDTSMRLTNIESNTSNYVENTSNSISIRITNIESNTSNYIENTSNDISMRLTNIESNTSNYVENTSNSISIRLTNIESNTSNYVENTSNSISIRLTNIESNTSNYVENTSNSISIRITNLESNTSNYVENTSNSISMRLTNIESNTSNYIENTSNDISMRLTNIESNTSNYIENTSNDISLRLTNIESNTSNYIENTSNDISLRLTNIVDTLNNNLVFSVSTNISSSETNLSIVDVFAKTRITTSGNTEFVHTFDVSISLNHNSLYHIVLFIVYNENKNFNKIDFNVMFSYYPIDDIVALNASIEFKTIKVKINYVSGNILQIIKSEPTINPIVNIISR